MFKHIVLLFGEDRFGVHETITRWKKAFIEKYEGDINVDEFEGSTAAHTIFEAAQTAPFLGEKRLIVVRNFLKEQDAEEQKRLGEMLKEVPETTTLVFLETAAPDKRTSFFKTLQKSCRLEEFTRPVGDELTRWILKRTEEKGGKIDWATATLLGQLAGDDLFKLNGEIEKLIAYTNGEPITPPLMKTLIASNAQTTIFLLTDALGNRRAGEALKQFKLMAETGEPLQIIYTMLTRQVRLLIQILELKQQGKNGPQIAQELGIHPYAVKSIEPQVRNFSLEELTIMYGKLVRIDRRLKTGAFTFTENEPGAYRLEMEKFLIEACVN